MKKDYSKIRFMGETYKSEYNIPFWKYVIYQVKMIPKYLFIVIMLSLMIIIASYFVSAVNSSDVSLITIHYWTFDEGTGTNAMNNITLAKNGTLNNVALWTANGKIGSGLNSTSTTGRYVTVPATVSGVVAINFWIKPAVTTSGYILNTGAETGEMHFDALGRLNSRSPNNNICNTSTNILTANTWSMVTYVINGSNGQFYINASPVTTSCGGSQDAYFSANNLYIVNYQNGNIPPVAIFDELQLFNGTPSQAVITYLFNSGNGLQPPFSASGGSNVSYNPVFVSQTPNDITTTNIIGSTLNITYNNSQTGITSAYLNYSFINNSNIINGSYYNGFNHSPYSNTSQIYNYVLDDNDVYPYVSNFDVKQMENTLHNNLIISNSNIFYLTKIIGLNSSKQNSFLEAYISSTGNSRVYYCNSSYSTGSITISPYCTLFGSTSSSTYNHTANQSKHNIFSVPILNGSINNVIVTTNSSIAVTSFTGTATVGYITGTVRSDATQLTNNNGNTWSNQNITIDMHIYQYNNDTEAFSYQECSVNATATLCSTSRSDYYNVTRLPPSVTTLSLNNNAFFYNDTLIANRNNATPFQGEINYYVYFLTDSNLNNIRNLTNNTNSSLLSMLVQNISAGLHYIGVYAVDTFNLTSIGYSEVFSVKQKLLAPCNTTITGNNTGAITTINYTTDITTTFTEVKGLQGLFNYMISNNTTGTVQLPVIGSGTYELWINTTSNDATNYYYDTGCYLGVCINNWVKNNYPCIDNLRLINYTDTNNCSLQYNTPSDINTYEDCITPANTDKELWFIIILFVFWALLIIGSMLWSWILGIVAFIVSSGIYYYTHSYFGTPFIGIMIAFVSLVIIFISKMTNK